MNFKSIVASVSQKSVLIKIVFALYEQSPYFIWALVYYISLAFVASNLGYLAVTVLFFSLIYVTSRDIRIASFIVAVACLPFSKGKTIDILLIPQEKILEFGFYDVGYYFPLYPSLFFFALSFYTTMRYGSPARLVLPSLYTRIGGLFLVWSSLPIFISQFPLVIALSWVQLLSFGVIYALPTLLNFSQAVFRKLSHVFAAFVLFESIWVLLQVLNGGPVGVYIESVLPLNRLGILSTEDAGFMRFSGTFYEPSILGTYMLMHLWYFAILFIKTKTHQTTDRWLYGVSMICTLCSILCTGSRGIYGLTVVSFLFWAIQIFRNSLMTISVLVCTILLILLNPYLNSRIASSTTLFNQYGSGTFRLILNSYAMRLANVHILGVGLNLSPYYFAVGFPKERMIDPSHPHNILFQILAETGYIGLILAVVYLWTLFRKHMAIGRRSSSFPYMAAALSYLICAQIYPIFISQQEIASYFFLFAGLMTAVTTYQHE